MINKFGRLFFGSLVAGMFFSCQMAPTKTSNQGELSARQLENPIQSFLKTNPVVLDARSPLDYSVSHTPGAISAQWQDFNKTGPGERGILETDELSLARRLSFWGIDRETPVLVGGNALQGQGEEGRIAWMLTYLGVKNVRMASWTQVRATIPRPEMAPENKPMWTPATQIYTLATPKEFEKAVLTLETPPSKARLQALQLDRSNSGFLTNSMIVLDVQDSETIEPALAKARIPIRKISWKKFVTAEGFAAETVKAELEKASININQTIYVISENGVSSGAVTFILRQWGYQAKNFSGGFDHLRRGK